MARLFIYAPPESERLTYAMSERSLPPGKYEARIYLDKRYKPKKGRAPKFRRKPDYTVELDLTWKTGMKNRTVIRAE